MTNAIIRFTGSAFVNASALVFVSTVSGFSSVSWASFKNKYMINFSQFPVDILIFKNKSQAGFYEGLLLKYVFVI
ncbi:MAG: hypothetical protein JRJ45_06340 [Deltaproteobacteria bacterium]|nr:hypothetical protein [Deltaproteobacteria bacterium]